MLILHIAMCLSNNGATCVARRVADYDRQALTNVLDAFYNNFYALRRAPSTYNLILTGSPTTTFCPSTHHGTIRPLPRTLFSRSGMIK